MMEQDGFSWTEALREEADRQREARRRRRSQSGRQVFNRLVELGALDPEPQGNGRGGKGGSQPP
ncbi:MAG: hypothetical protein HS116_10490 [Planctomycetes bacterium]|nr:hypothetical protein [Planctomycetota bacterium]